MAQLFGQFPRGSLFVGFADIYGATDHDLIEPGETGQLLRPPIDGGALLGGDLSAYLMPDGLSGHGGGLTAKARQRREAVRLEAAGLFAEGVKPPEIARVFG